MKKFGKVILGSILCICLFVLLTSTVYAEDLTAGDIAGKVQSAGIADVKFAEAIAEALVNAGYTDDSLYSSDSKTAETLASYGGKIDASNRGIYSIEGISMLTGADEIVLNNNYIADITPIISTTPYRAHFYIQNNPVRIYFPCVSDESKPKDWYCYATSKNYDSAIVTGQVFETKLNVISGGEPLTVKLNFGVSEDGKFYWNTLNGETKVPYLEYTDNEEAVTFSYTYQGPEDYRSNTCQVTISADVMTRVRAYYELYRYYSNWDDDPTITDDDPQAHGVRMGKSPDFKYTLNVAFYTPFKQNTETELLTGLVIVKTDADGKPLAGAEFELYSDAECQNMVGSGVSGSNGELIFGSLEEGIYYYKEVAAPAGYKLDETVHSVELKVEDINLSTEFVGGYQTVENVVVGSSIELEPQWEDWDLDPDVKKHPMKVTTGSYDSITASGDILAYFKNKGETVSVLENEISADDLDKLVFKGADLMLTVNDVEFAVDNYENAKEVINALINEGNLLPTGDVIELNGTVTYEEKIDNYTRVECKDESLCVFIKPCANKKLIGRAIKAGEFGFVFSGADCAGDVLFSGLNSAAGANEDTTEVEFTNDLVEDGDIVLRFCQVGEYTFTLKEVIPDEKEEGMKYDDTEYVVTVTVTESGEKGLKAVLKVNGKEVLTTYSTETTDADNTPLVSLATTKLCTIVNTFTKRENPKTGVPTLFSLVDLFTLAGLGVVLKKKFF